MSDRGILPEGEALRRAVQWISERRREEPEKPLYRVIEEAAVRFDLTPPEVDYLARNLAGP